MSWLAGGGAGLAIGLVLLGSVGMMLSMLICVADVIGTNFSTGPCQARWRSPESTMVLIASARSRSRRRSGGHIRVEILHGYMSPRVQSLFDLVTHFLALAVLRAARLVQLRRALL
jgi:TRAP-type mannitol/chloroaromatic compound transport system permease small subunit